MNNEIIKYLEQELIKQVNQQNNLKIITQYDVKTLIDKLNIQLDVVDVFNQLPNINFHNLYLLPIHNKLDETLLAYQVSSNNRYEYDLLPLLIYKLANSSKVYISLESALSAYGIISQIPFIITLSLISNEIINNNYKTITYHTELGNFEFNYIPNDNSELNFSEYNIHYNDIVIPYANENLALKDLKLINRNLHLIEYE